MRFQQITQDVDSLRTRRADSRPFILTHMHAVFFERNFPGICLLITRSTPFDAYAQNLTHCVQVRAWLVQFGDTELQPLH